MALVVTTLVMSCDGSSNIDSFGAGLSADKLTVTRINPADDDNGVDASANVSVYFSTELDVTTLQNDSIRLYSVTRRQAIPVDYIYSEVRRLVTIDPKTKLDAGKYLVQINDNIRDKNGAPLSIQISSAFFVASENEFSVVQTRPIAESSDVKRDRNLDISFSHDLDRSTINLENFTLHDLSADKRVPVDISSSYGNSVVLNPKSRLQRDTLYEIRVSPVVANQAGRAIASEFSSQFRTSAEFIAPIAETISSELTDNKVNPGIEQLYIEFSEEIDPATVDEGDNFLQNIETRQWIATTAFVEGRRLIIKPSAPLEYSTVYRYGYYGAGRSTIQNFNGDIITARHAWDFTTTGLPAVELEESYKEYKIDSSTNSYFGIARWSDTLTKVDLSNSSIVSTLALDGTPMNLCIDAEDGRLYVMQVSVSEARIQADGESRPREFHTYLYEYSTTDLGLVGRTEIDSAYTSVISMLLSCKGGEFYYYNDQSLYTFSKENPTFTRVVAERLEEVAYTDPDDFLTGASVSSVYANLQDRVALQRTRFNRPGTYSVEKERRWFLSEDQNLAISGSSIWRLSSNWTESLYTAESEILAVDFDNRVFATEAAIYSLDGFEKIGEPPLSKISAMFFDAVGNLHIKRITSHSLYRLSRDLITPEGLLQRN